MASLADAPKPTVGKAIYEDLSKIKNAWPEVSDTYEKIKGGLGDMADKSRETTAESQGYFDGLWNDIATGFGNTVQEWLTGATTFKDFLEGIWGNIKDSFFRMIGEMASSAVLGKFKDLFSGIASAGKDALGGISKVAGNIGQAAGSAASGFLSALGSVGSIVTGITSVISLLQGPQKQTDVTYWLKFIRESTLETRDWLFINAQEKLNYFAEKLEDIKIKAGDMVSTRLDVVCTKLDWIGKIAEGVLTALGKLKGAQFGARLTEPQLVMTHGTPERPEYIIPEPDLKGFMASAQAGQAAGKAGATDVNVTFQISAVDGDSVEKITRTKIVPVLQNIFDHYGLGVPLGAVKGY
jgi:hypothetical protein